ncbi:MAG: HlyC/CorC family transporter [Ruminococcus sp.]|nr:HlyC/CorC family transporter [Ruminococcus sp.]
MSDDGLQSKEKKQGFMERLFKTKGMEEHKTQTEEEILSLVEEGKEKGLIEDDTQSVIENIFDFDDTSVSEIMTHRMDMVALEDTNTLEEIKKVAIESGHSRIPVYKDDTDNIIGILYVKDLLRYVGVPYPEHFKLKSILRPVMFVPRTKDLRSLFEEMTKNKTQIAVVVDEYGGTEGIVTLEDLIEDILGNIQDEYDHEEEEIRKIDENRFTVDGSTSLEDVEELVGKKLPESDCETVAGLILENLGRIPQDSETPSVEIGGLKLTAVKTDERRITEVLIEKMEEDEE